MHAPGWQEVVDRAQKPAPQGPPTGVKVFLKPLHGRGQTGLFQDSLACARILLQPANQAFVVGRFSLAVAG